jgi:hypothetical protein
VSPTATVTGSLVLLVLTASQPTGRVAQPRAPGVTMARLSVRDVNNSSGQGLQFAVALEDAATPARHVEVGNFSLYPSNHSGIFALPLPAAAADLARQGPTVLTVNMAPALAGATLQPDVSVSLTAELARS